MFTNTFCDCVDCDSILAFGAIDADQACTPEVFQSEICGIGIFPDSANLPTDWTNKADWTAVINNYSTAGESGKYMAGIGSIDAPEKNQVTVGKGKPLTVMKIYQVNFTIKNLSDLQYLFLKKLQCNPNNYRFFIENNGGHVFGSSLGIRPIITDVDFIYAVGQESIEQANLVIRWKGLCDPQRAYIPNLSSDFTATPSEFTLWGTADGGTTAYGIADGSGITWGTFAS